MPKRTTIEKVTELLFALRDQYKGFVYLTCDDYVKTSEGEILKRQLVLSIQVGNSGRTQKIIVEEGDFDKPLEVLMSEIIKLVDPTVRTD